MPNDPVHSFSDFVPGLDEAINTKVSAALVEARLADKADKLSHHVDVQSLADFPVPVANIITLDDNAAYLINGNVDISPNRIVCGIRNKAATTIMWSVQTTANRGNP